MLNENTNNLNYLERTYASDTSFVRNILSSIKFTYIIIWDSGFGKEEDMEVIRKVCLAFLLVALVSFVGGLAGAEDNVKISINTATIEELTSLQGIGEKKAKSIVEHREKAGSFAAIEDLKDVKGVGDKIFNKIKDQITIE